MTDGAPQSEVVVGQYSSASSGVYSAPSAGVGYVGQGQPGGTMSSFQSDSTYGDLQITPQPVGGQYGATPQPADGVYSPLQKKGDLQSDGRLYLPPS